ncbi:uroporphyrinogen-III synthase [Bacteroidales bacterium]|nr:uroporphyrinogen-III synthase [Bacteroidales bacterium]
MSGLAGKNIISTCAINKAQKLDTLLKHKKAVSHIFPLIDVVAADDNKSEIKSLLTKLDDYKWLLFTSSNGVKYFFYWLNKFNIEVDLLKSKNIAAIGDATDHEVKKHGFKTHYISKQKHSKYFAEELKFFLTTNNKALLIKGNLAPSSFKTRLQEFCMVSDLIVYNTQMPEYINNNILQKIESNNYDLLLFLSPSAFSNFKHILAPTIDIKKIRCASIGDTTSDYLKNNGVEPVLKATEPNIEVLIDDIEKYYLT